MSVERTEGEISAHCNKEGANFLAINLAHENVIDQRNVDSAREEYARTVDEFMTSGTIGPYMSSFQFDLPTVNSNDPDEPAEMSSERQRRRQYSGEIQPPQFLLG